MIFRGSDWPVRQTSGRDELIARPSQAIGRSDQAGTSSPPKSAYITGTGGACWGGARLLLSIVYTSALPPIRTGKFVANKSQP